MKNRKFLLSVVIIIALNLAFYLFFTRKNYIYDYRLMKGKSIPGFSVSNRELKEVKARGKCYSTSQLSENSTSKLSLDLAYCSQAVFRNILVSFFSDFMPGDHFASAFDDECRPLQFGPDTPVDIGLGDSVKMPIIGNRGRL